MDGWGRERRGVGVPRSLPDDLLSRARHISPSVTGPLLLPLLSRPSDFAAGCLTAVWPTRVALRTSPGALGVDAAPALRREAHPGGGPASQWVESTAAARVYPSETSNAECQALFVRSAPYGPSKHP